MAVITRKKWTQAGNIARMDEFLNENPEQILRGVTSVARRSDLHRTPFTQDY